MGLTSSKQKYQQQYHPSKTPTYGHGQGFVPNHAHGFIPGQMYGYVPQPGTFPPGFVPTGYGSFPQPMLSWPPTQEKSRKRKSRRRRQDGAFPLGSRLSGNVMHRAPSNGGPTFPVPEIAPSTNRRAQTPFMRPSMDQADDDDDDDDDDDNDHRPIRPIATPHPQPALGIRRQESTAGRQQSNRGQTPGPPPVQPLHGIRRHSEDFPPRASAGFDSLDHTRMGAFGHSDQRPRGALSNPLPDPPRDIYETTPYRDLLIDLPQTSALLAKYGDLERHSQPVQPLHPPHLRSAESKKPKRGLFSAFSTKKSDRTRDGGQEPANTPISAPSSSAAHRHSRYGHLPAMPPLGGPNPTSFAGIAVTDPPIPRPPPPTTHIPEAPIRFNQDTEHAGFLNHSPHRIWYEDRVYPTATHLLEALKFLPHREDIAERLRACRDVVEVYPLSASLQQYAKPDWGDVYLDEMKSVLKLKFTQNADLRSQLLDTFDAELIYDDPMDSFWGDGQGGGANTYGRLLEQVRTILQEGRSTRRPS